MVGCTSKNLMQYHSFKFWLENKLISHRKRIHEDISSKVVKKAPQLSRIGVHLDHYIKTFIIALVHSTCFAFHSLFINRVQQSGSRSRAITTTGGHWVGQVPFNKMAKFPTLTFDIPDTALMHSITHRSVCC